MDCSPLGSLVHGASPGKNSEGDCHSLLQGIFLTQELIPGLPHCRQILYCLSHQGSPQTLCKILLVSRPFSGAALRYASALGINTEATWVCAMSPWHRLFVLGALPNPELHPHPQPGSSHSDLLALPQAQLSAGSRFLGWFPPAVHMVDSPHPSAHFTLTPQRSRPTGNLLETRGLTLFPASQTQGARGNQQFVNTGIRAISGEAGSLINSRQLLFISPEGGRRAALPHHAQHTSLERAAL